MNVAVVGLEKQDLIAHIGNNYPGFAVVDSNPELVFCYGGDGTFLYAERQYPGVPKALLRNSKVCFLCFDVNNDTALALIQDGQYTVEEQPKLEAVVNGSVVYAVNDVIIGHARANSTLRANIYMNGEQYERELFGDGCIISTPIGSTGYYQSITRSNFEDGIGLAFNNSIHMVNHLALASDTVIEVEVTRGPGVLAYDNDETQIPITTGDRVEIRQSVDHTAKLIRLHLSS